MQKTLNERQNSIKLVAVSDEAKDALKELVKRNKALKLSQGQITSALIMKAYESKESILG